MEISEGCLPVTQIQITEMRLLQIVKVVKQYYRLFAALLILVCGLLQAQWVARACGLDCVAGADKRETLAQASGQAMIGDYVWQDIDGNGLQDDGADTGFANVRVLLYLDDSDGVFEPQTGDTLQQSTVSDAVGLFKFETTLPGSYWVEVDRDTLVGGLVEVGGIESAISPHLLKVLPGQIYDTVDFGFTAVGSITGIVFYDRNADGYQGLGEEGASDVEVCLYKETLADGQLGLDDILVDCKRTDEQGAYVFKDVLFGDYLIAESPRPDVGHVTPSMFAINFNPWVVSGTVIDAIGDVLLARIVGVTYLDSNGNGFRDPSETYGARGLVITATNLETGESFATVSDAGGEYELSGLMPNAYRVTATNQALNLVATTVTDVTLTLGFGETYSGMNFGYLPPTEVNLVDFTANAWGSGAILYWSTSYEFEEDGFYLWRALKEAGPYEIVSALIPATNNPGGAEYQWMDLSVGRGQTYWYKLQAMPGGGFAGPIPVSIDPGPGDMTSWVFTPLIVR